MREIVGLGVSCLREGRREQWADAVATLESLVEAWYRERMPEGQERRETVS